MTIHTMYGLYWRGHYFVREVMHHSEAECSLTNYAEDAVRELFELYPREHICAKLDTVLSTFSSFSLACWVMHKYLVDGEPAVDATHPRYDPMCAEIRARAEPVFRDSPGQLEKYCARNRIAVHRFQDLFASGNVLAFDERTPAESAERGLLHQERESLFFELTRYGALYTPSVAYIVDLERNHLFTLANWTASVSRDTGRLIEGVTNNPWVLRPREHCIVVEHARDPAQWGGRWSHPGVLKRHATPGAIYPTLELPPDSQWYCGTGGDAFYTVQPLDVLLLRRP